MLLSFAFISQVTVFASYAPYVVVEKHEEHVIKPKIDIRGPQIVKVDVSYYSQKYGVPESILAYVIEKESHYNEKAVGDMNIVCRRTGLPVRARGILQITECFYPEISDECAFDAKCSLETMLPIMANPERCRSQWSTCRDYYLKYEQKNSLE